MNLQTGEEGPLGLPPVTFRMRLADAFTAAAGGEGDTNSLVLTATPSFSSLSSSDLDTESTMSFFPEKSITLGSLIGIAGAAAHPSFRYSLSSKTPSGRLSRLTHRSDSGAKLWSFIRCGTCRGAYYADDNSSIGPPPSLGHFLEAEREAERSGNDAKVYINIMYEEATSGSSYAPEAVNPLFDSDTSRGVNINGSSYAAVELPMIAEEDAETPISSPFGRSGNRSSAAAPPADSMQSMDNDGQTSEVASRSIRAVASSRSTRKHRRSHSDGVCVLNCVSYIWGFRNLKVNGSRDTDSSCASRIKERKCGPAEEVTASNYAVVENGFSYTNYSFDETIPSANFDETGEAWICSSNSGLNETDFASIAEKGGGQSWAIR